MTHKWIRTADGHRCSREGCNVQKRLRDRERISRAGLFKGSPVTVIEFSIDGGLTWWEMKKVPKCGGDK